MPSARSIARDLRALGSSAPLRAAYETSKRSGFHAVLFREVRDRGHRSVPIGLGRLPTSEIARKRCLEDAAATLSEGTRVFGRRVPTGVHAPWNIDPLTGSAWPQEDKWWRIDIRSDERLSDVKWVWEAARHRDVVVLARAAALEPDGPWLAELEAMLRGWLAQCRPERGVNWYSSLELALRAIAWAQLLALVGDRLDATVRAGLDAQLVASARHIMLELPYTVSSMKNNHLLGDGLGLVVLGRMFPTHPSARRWQRIGDALFLKQLARHVHDDGSMIEDSLSYHRFVMEMLMVRALLGEAALEVHRALAGAAHHLRNMGALDGDVPQYGDWDEGRVLADSQPAGSVAGSVWAALALSGIRVPDEAFHEYDEVAWYVDPRTQDSTSALAPLAGARRAGNFHVITDGDLSIWVKTGTSPSHQHADIGSVWIRQGDAWLVQDPGTGTYNGPIAVRNGFRASSAHPVWRPEGSDQLVPHRAFRWLRRAHVSSAESFGERRSLVLTMHDAFRSEPEQARVARLVDVGNEQVRIVDFIESAGERPWVMSVPLGVTDAAERLYGVGKDARRGLVKPFVGWRSATYGEWTPADWLQLRLHGKVHAWGVGMRQTQFTNLGAVVDETDYIARWSDDGLMVTAICAGSAPIELQVKNG